MTLLKKIAPKARFFSIQIPVSFPATMTSQTIPAFQRLPSDILDCLFEMICLGDPLNGPILISHISRFLRQSALNCSSIWCNITICLRTSSQNHPRALAYFERSTKNRSIFLTVYAFRQFQPREKAELLLPHAHRFRTLHIEASSGSLANQLWLELNIPMPDLEAFDSVVSNSRISVSRKIGAVEGMVNIIPSVSTRNLVCWDSWSPTGLTILTLDTTRLLNKPTLGDIYNALATTCNTIQHFEYVGLIACIDAASGINIRTRLIFPELYSLAVLSHDNMVPLLRLMAIPALTSLILRDFIAYPHIPTIPASYLTYIDELTEDLAFDPAGLFRVIEEWKSITHLEIFGIDNLPSDPSLPPPDLLNYLKSLNQLSSLVLYGDGVATSIEIVLFANNSADSDSEEPLLLPQLSHFLLAVNHDEMANDDICDYCIARHRHNLPRLQMLTVNGEYIQYLVDLNRINILWESSDDIFVITDPEYGDYNSMDRVNLVERIPRE